MLCQELAELLGPNSTNLSILYTEAFKIIDLYILKKKYIYIFAVVTGRGSRQGTAQV